MPDATQRYTCRVLQTIQMNLILLCVWAKYGDYEYATINSVVNKNFDSRFEVICLKILGTEFSAWAT